MNIRMYKSTCYFFSLYLLLFSFASAQELKRIKLNNGDDQIKVYSRQDLVINEFTKGRWKDRYYGLIYYDRLPHINKIKYLKNIGGNIIEVLSDNFYLVRFKNIPTSESLRNAGVKGVGQLAPKLKISAKLQPYIIENNKDPIKISVLLHKGESVKEIIPDLEKLGFIPSNLMYQDRGLLTGTVSRNNLLIIAGFPFVRYLSLFDYSPKPLIFRENGVFGLNYLTNSVYGKGLSGNGVTVGIGDNADPTSHLDNQFKNINRNPSYILSSYHGTMVTGIVSGDGIIDERFVGVAPKAQTITDFYDYILTKSEIYNKDFGMTVTNNSYYLGYSGCPGNGEYNELSFYLDDQLYALNNMQHIFAAGNDGELNCNSFPKSFATIKSGFQVSKNVLTVGDFAFSFNPRVISESSSRGPVNDGRIKPEIVAPGNSIFSTSLNNAYGQDWGTSFAAPFVAGFWSLLTERYRQLNNGNSPPAGLLKSVFCNTASDKGNPGPDYTHGFGLVNPNRALDAIETNRYLRASVSQGNSFNHTIDVPQGTKKIKVMLYWHDRPGSPLAQKALQNDLDLQVTDRNNIYLPWVLDPTEDKVNLPAVRKADHLNNIEQVTIDNPGSNIDVSIFGYNILDDNQDFYLTWEFISGDLKIIRPQGGERFALGSTSEIISWDVADETSDSLTIEYSIDNGVNWNLLADNIAESRMFIGWPPPTSISSSKAKIRLKRKNNGSWVETPGTFSIMGFPQLTASSVCDGAVDLSWTAVSNATDYEVLQLENGEWQSVTFTPELKYAVRGLSKSRSYWFSVRARIQDSLGRRATAKRATPALTTPCLLPEFNNDLAIDGLMSPLNGRMNTSSQLSNTETIIARIKNLDDVSSVGSIEVYYQINGGVIVQEQVNSNINPGKVIDYAFNTKADLSSPGIYTIKLWVKQNGDNRISNDTGNYNIKHLPNEPIQLPFVENFESTNKDEYRNNTFGLQNITRFDYTNNTSNGRLRTFVNTGIAPEGNRAITLDASQFLGISNLNQNQLIGTFNCSNFNLGEGLRLDFLYKNQGQLKSPKPSLWIRGQDNLSWIKAYEIDNSQYELEKVRTGMVNLYEVLNSAGQPLTSSFQIMVQQLGRTSANNETYFTELFDLDDGLTIDKLRIINAKKDLMIASIISPDTIFCRGTQNFQYVTVQIKNTTSEALINIPVTYRLNKGMPVTENIPLISSNSELKYTFSTTIPNLDNGENKLDVWVSHPDDDYKMNDSILDHRFRLSKIITQFPYLEKFENDNGGWFTTSPYSSWTWGSTNPIARTLITSSANGNKSWFTSLSGGYLSNESSYLYSPCFNLSTLSNPVLSFSHISQQERGRDFHQVEWSINNGLTWQRLGLQNNGTNWYDTSAQYWNRSVQRWHVSSTDLPTGPSNIRFRFLMSSDDFNQAEGIGIDDVHIFDKATIYQGQNTMVSQPVSGNDYVHFISDNNLIASINPLGQSLGNVAVGVYINQDSVRLLNNQYYLDRNLVIQSENVPSDSVLIRFYFTEDEIKKMINTTKCNSCIKLNNAYIAAITKYSGLPEYENGILNDGFGGVYQFIDASKIDIIPFNNGYYAEFKAKSFSEFWIHTLNYNLSQIPLSVNDPSVSRDFIINTLFSTTGQLIVNPANQRGIKEVNIRLMNAAGQEVLNVSKPYERTLIEVGDIANGIYFITITDKSGKYHYRSKIIK